MPRPACIPKRTHGQRRGAVVPVRFTDDDRDALAMFAAKHGASLSGLLSSIGHQLALGGGDQVAVLAEPAPVFREIAHTLTRLSGTLYNLSRMAAGGKVVSPAAELEQLREQVRALKAEVRPWVR